MAGVSEPPLPQVATGTLPRWPGEDDLTRVGELVDGVAGRCFDEEAGCAMRHALALVWEIDPAAVARLPSARSLAAGLAWVVGRANGLYGARGRCSQRDVQAALDLSGALSTPARQVERIIVGFGTPPTTSHLSRASSRWATSSSSRPPPRRALVRVRDRAVRDREIATALLPSKVE